MTKNTLRDVNINFSNLRQILTTSDFTETSIVLYIASFFLLFQTSELGSTVKGKFVDFFVQISEGRQNCLSGKNDFISVCLGAAFRYWCKKCHVTQFDMYVHEKEIAKSRDFPGVNVMIKKKYFAQTW
jgi:hypothetical protein